MSLLASVTLSDDFKYKEILFWTKNCHCSQSVTVTSVTVSGEACTNNAILTRNDNRDIDGFPGGVGGGGGHDRLLLLLLPRRDVPLASRCPGRGRGRVPGLLIRAPCPCMAVLLTVLILKK